jgi:THO complex subunit 2
MDVRNALLVLTKIVKVYPLVHKLAVLIERRVLKIKEDSREDLKVLANRSRE